MTVILTCCANEHARVVSISSSSSSSSNVDFSQGAVALGAVA
jgi:hypothetical protein